MKWYTVIGSALLIVLLSTFSSAAKAACIPTGFYVDGINMTAALINPGQFNGQTLNALGCNIGIYFDDGTDGGAGAGGSVYGSTISGANYFGIVVNGGGGNAPVSVGVESSTITNIGETPHNGTQHGNAVFYINGSTSTGSDNSRTCGADNSTTGTIYNDTVSGYQKNGITVKCPGVSVAISNNTVTGAGAVDYIAQNGIEVGLGALATVSGNTVSDNEYTGANNADSSGVLVFGGSAFGGAYASNETVSGNHLTDNDVGIFSVNCDGNCTAAPTTPTNNVINGNKISKSDVTNVSGCGSVGYQAGISEIGLNDMIKNNKISGKGYGPTGAPYCAVTTLLQVDLTGSGALKQYKVPGGPLQKGYLPKP